MDAAEINYSLDDVQVRFERGASPKTGARLEVSPELLRFLGYHMSEGSINRTERNYSMALYNKDPEVLTDMRHCIKTICGKAPRERETHGFGTATELQFNHKTLFELIKTHCGTKSDNLRIPDLIFGLSKEKIGQFLSGLYSGDSTMRSDRFVYYTTSRELANDLALLLLVFGIVCRIRKRKRAGRKTIDYEIKFCRERDKKEFLKYVHPVGKSVGVIKGGRPNPYLKGDVFIDKVREIEKIHLNKPVPVYDLSVPGTQNFIGGFGGILLHNTGHPAMATIHAATIPQLIDRLITPPISLPPTLLENVDVVVFLTLSRLKGVYVRRADTILEVTGTKKNMPVTNKVFEWKPVTDTFEIAGDSVALKKIAKKSGITDEAIKAELLRRKLVLEWMLEQGILDYKEVAKVISAYYSNPDRIMDMVTGT
ncbi:MAG: LAGLIDADG family homing endonuclease [Candidatus Aenigmatarchaeota archaeon]